MSEASIKFKPPHDVTTQGLVASGFGHLLTGRALFLEFGWDAADGAEPRGRWLEALGQVAPISDADGRDERAAALAFTWTGLARMGMPASALASFGRPFREGMYQEDRLRRLGDRRGGVWLSTVGETSPRWSANTPVRPPTAGAGRIGAYDVPRSDEPEAHVETELTVHALLLLYEKSEEVAEAWCRAVADALEPHRIRVVHRLPLFLDPVDRKVSSEHFGFADGLSQPLAYDEQAVAQNPPEKGCNTVPLGEVLIGHMNGHQERAPGPVVPDDEAGRPAKAALKPHPDAVGFYDFGANGSYMVVRELRQDVVAFWRSMRLNAERIRMRDPQGSAHVTPEWIAERVIGRSRDGHLLCPQTTACPSGYLAPRDGMPDNDFLFFKNDRYGTGCPAGSHVRRANPRDSLAPTPEQTETLLAAANNHRLLRRGRKYGRPIEEADLAAEQDDQVDRGLLFICLGTDIARQFEFVQQTWLLNENFATLYDEQDPLLGPAGPMTIHEEPLRRRLHVDTFVRLAGGDYFFLPSLPALRYLAML